MVVVAKLNALPWLLGQKNKTLTTEMHDEVGTDKYYINANCNVILFLILNVKLNDRPLSNALLCNPFLYTNPKIMLIIRACILKVNLVCIMYFIYASTLSLEKDYSTHIEWHHNHNWHTYILYD